MAKAIGAARVPFWMRLARQVPAGIFEQAAQWLERDAAFSWSRTTQ
jgi:hypothetical protein